MRFWEISEKKSDDKSTLCSINQRGIYPEPIEFGELEELDPGVIEKRKKLKKYQGMTDDEKRLAEIPEVDPPIMKF